MKTGKWKKICHKLWKGVKYCERGDRGSGKVLHYSQGSKGITQWPIDLNPQNYPFTLKFLVEFLVRTLNLMNQPFKIH